MVIQLYVIKLRSFISNMRSLNQGNLALGPELTFDGLFRSIIGSLCKTSIVRSQEAKRGQVTLCTTSEY